VSGEAHPKELDETWDSQIFRYSKMFPLRTKFFCYQALLLPTLVYPRPDLLHPPASTLSLSALSFKYTLMSRAWITLSFTRVY
jgi:ATP/ADP translocase